MTFFWSPRKKIGDLRKNLCCSITRNSVQRSHYMCTAKVHDNQLFGNYSAKSLEPPLHSTMLVVFLFCLAYVSLLLSGIDSLAPMLERVLSKFVKDCHHVFILKSRILSQSADCSIKLYGFALYFTNMSTKHLPLLKGCYRLCHL